MPMNLPPALLHIVSLIRIKKRVKSRFTVEFINLFYHRKAFFGNPQIRNWRSILSATMIGYP